MNRTTLLTTACLVAASLVVGCSGGDNSADTTQAAPATVTPSIAVSTTAASSTTSSTITSTTSTVPVEPLMPLTGMAITDPAVAQRPALVVKIDNNAQARPQEGLAEADIVFEEIVEFQTRFAAIFHSVDPARVGPIRSGRTQDVDMLGSFNQPLFAWSGGNPGVTKAIDDSDLFDIGVMRDGAVGYVRDRRGKSNIDPEHTLFADPAALRTMAPADHPAPPQQFQYRTAEAAASGADAAGVDVDMDGLAVAWRWNAADGVYRRDQNRRPHQTTTGQVVAQNVVIVEVAYVPSRVDVRSPEAQTIGSGTVTVYTGGRVVEGTWTRADRLQPFVLTNAAGKPILLTPGKTWVELAKPGTSTTVA
ncbi:MAG TPA: DUF3048 domain-containing protein [Ilumatobacteraceae bacterium]|nr:DUF3048 domain-containing protein [Ilumatobacteraceae bacterium]